MARKDEVAHLEDERRRWIASYSKTQMYAIECMKGTYRLELYAVKNSNRKGVEWEVSYKTDITRYSTFRSVECALDYMERMSNVHKFKKQAMLK